MTQQQWFVVRGGGEEGPYTGQQLKDMAAGGRLQPGDLVRRGDVETARPARAVKGLFPAGPTDSAPVGSSPAQSRPSPPPLPRSAVPDSPSVQGSGSKRRLLIASAVLAGICVVCCGGGGLLYMKSRQSAERGLGEGDKRWDAGDKAGAAEKYRALLESATAQAALDADERARVYGRLIDYDVERGEAESAKKWVADAVRKKASPAVTHPEAKKLVAQAEPKGGDPNAVPDDDVFKDRLTARFLPCVPGNVKKYEEEIYDASTGRSLVYMEDREVYGKDQTVTVDRVLKSPGVPPSKASLRRSVRRADGYVEFGLAAGGDYNWERLVKVGARSGDEWPDGGGKGTYRLVRFDKTTAQGPTGPYDLVQAVVERRWEEVDGRGVRTPNVTEAVLEWDGGVQSVKSYMTVNGKKRLIRHRRLVSSTSE